MAKSPSISIFENDLSAYVDTTTASIPAIVGFSTKGEFFKAKKVFGLKDFEANFGKAPAEDPWTYLTVKRAFNQTGQILFMRVGNTATALKSEEDILSQQEVTGTSAYASLNIIFATSSVSIVADQGFTLTVTDWNGTLDETIQINFETDLGLTAGSTVTRTAFAEALNSFFANDVSYSTYLRSYVNSITGNVVIETTGTIFAGRTVAISNEPTIGDEEFSVYFIGGSVSLGTAVVEKANDQIGSIGFNVTVEAKQFGTHGNSISVVKDSRVSAVDQSVIHRISVFSYGIQVEQFDNVSLDPTSATFFARVINADPDNGGSSYISFPDWNSEEEAWAIDTATFIVVEDSEEDILGFASGDQILINGSYMLSGGNDGIIDNPASLFITALSSNGDLGNTDEFTFDYLATPAIQNSAVVDAAIQLAENGDKQDFIYIADPEFGYTSDQVIKWHNGQLGEAQALNSEFVATYWPWLKDTHPTTGEVIWVPPSVFMVEKFLFVDKSFGPWFAPAGEKRGILSARGYQFNPSKSVRDQLYGDQNAVNPITFFSGKGLIVFGQKTTLRTLSAKNRLSVRRMLNSLKKQMKTVLDSILFDPNIPATVNEARNRLNNILERVRQNGGIDKFSVFFDPDPALAQQNILKGIVTIVPFGTVENIELYINTQQVGSEITG